MAYSLEIVTPERSAYSGQVHSLRAPGVEGSFGVLLRHAPMVAALRSGAIEFQEESGERRKLATSGGFVEVSPEGTTVLVETAEFGEQIDRARAHAARDRALQRLQQDEDVDRARAQVALGRALARLQVAGD
ncbi:MAG: F0F1 ATP synthase subunit epsilon [Candidatus Latescibacterota bacterium]|nr:F0F1 ATP synthase subunit epsilon [Candidatus Latescibacterota bacterium]